MLTPAASTSLPMLNYGYGYPSPKLAEFASEKELRKSAPDVEGMRLPLCGAEVLSVSLKCEGGLYHGARSGLQAAAARQGMGGGAL